MTQRHLLAGMLLTLVVCVPLVILVNQWIACAMPLGATVLCDVYSRFKA